MYTGGEGEEAQGNVWDATSGSFVSSQRVRPIEFFQIIIPDLFLSLYPAVIKLKVAFFKLCPPSTWNDSTSDIELELKIPGASTLLSNYA